MSDSNFDTNHAHADADEAWEEIVANQPEIPALAVSRAGVGDPCVDRAARMQDPANLVWHELGEHDWDLSVSLGRFGDDRPENEIAQERLEVLREHLRYLTAEQLLCYIDGMHSSMNQFFWRGL